jgi:hypothetical protein
MSSIADYIAKNYLSTDKKKKKKKKLRRKQLQLFTMMRIHYLKLRKMNLIMKKRNVKEY